MGESKQTVHSHSHLGEGGRADGRPLWTSNPWHVWVRAFQSSSTLGHGVRLQPQGPMPDHDARLEGPAARPRSSFE
eukprot:6635741-Pyramimonas_sp.AAC.1